MKKTIITLSLMLFAIATYGQTKPTQTKSSPVSTKTIIATYQNGINSGGEWSGLIFLDSKEAELRFLNTNNLGKQIVDFWNPKVSIPSTEDNPTEEYHTVTKNVGNKYKLTYTTKKVKHKGFDVNGGSTSNENVIISYELIESKS